METIELLEGVEILSVSESMPIIASVFCGLLCLVVIGLSTYLLIDSIICGSGGGVLLSIVFLVIGVLLSCVVIGETVDPKFTYKVTVDDSVSMNEFYDKYEVVNVDGKIYSIQEKGE